MVSFYHSYYNYTSSIHPSRVKLTSLKFDCKTTPLYYGVSESVITLNKTTPIKCTKYWLNKLSIIKENRKKTNPTCIREVTLNTNIFKQTGRCVVQSSLMDSISIVVEPTNYDSVTSSVLGITSNINTFNNLKFHSLKNYITKNKNETFDTLIIPFLMTSLTKIEHDKIRICK